MRMKLYLSALLAAFSGYTATQCNAAITLTMAENAGTVVTFWSGSVNTGGLGTPTTFSQAPGLVRGQFNLWTAAGETGLYDSYFVPGIVTFNFNAPGGFAIPGVGTGDSVGMQENAPFISLPRNYVSDTPISGSSTAVGTFASLGIIDGVTSTATWDAGAAGIQTITFVTDIDAPVPPTSVVPEPSTLAVWSLLALAFGGLSINRRRK